jgi:hypothetical protein
MRIWSSRPSRSKRLSTKWRLLASLRRSRLPRSCDSTLRKSRSYLHPLSPFPMSHSHTLARRRTTCTRSFPLVSTWTPGRSLHCSLRYWADKVELLLSVTTVPVNPLCSTSSPVLSSPPRDPSTDTVSSSSPSTRNTLPINCHTTGLPSSTSRWSTGKSSPRRISSFGDNRSADSVSLVLTKPTLSVSSLTVYVTGMYYSQFVL